MNNQKLIIMRHGKSDWKSDTAADFDRPLARRGRQDVPRMAEWLTLKALVPDLIVSSPACRARETAELAAGEWGYETGKIIFDETLYLAPLKDLLQVIKTNSGGTRLLLIGHNPGLEELLEFLSRDRPVYRRGKLLTTSALAVLDFGTLPMSTGRASARLELLIHPR